MINRQSQLALNFAPIRPSPRSLHIPPDFPSPATFGLPSTFPEWRPAQLDAVNRIIDSDKRFVVICAPTGIGKSLLAAAAALMSSRRTIILTSTLGLADQYQRAFSDISADVRGMGNYRCHAAPSLGLSPNTVVSDAPCLMGYRCPMRFSGCDYFDAYRQARNSNLVTTTYQCWMYDALKDPREAIHTPPLLDDRGNPVDMLICDEAAEAVEEIQRFVSISISRRECLHLHLDWPEPENKTLDDWRDWADGLAPEIKSRMAIAEQKVKNGAGNGNGNGSNGNGSNGTGGWLRELKVLREMYRKLDRLSTITLDDQWIMSPRTDPDTRSVDAVEFTPLEPARFAESALWRRVNKVVLLSATIRPKTAAMLGIPHDQMTFIEYPSTFPAARRPIIVVPTVMLSHRTEQDDAVMLRWLHRIDAIISGRLDRKGIIHTASYARAKFLFDNSTHRGLMLIHNSRDRAQVIEEFMHSPAPRILVSPSLSTGYDFAGDLARYAIIAKLPFQTVTDPVTRARQAIDPEYGIYLTAQDIVQSSGRIMRSEQDFGETFIVDDSFGNWFYRRARKFFPEWWLDAVVWADGVPPVNVGF